VPKGWNRVLKNPGDSLRFFSTGSFASTGHNEIAQGRAQRHPGYTGDLGAPPPQFAKALKGRNITHGFTRRRFRPFRAWVVSGISIPGRRFALPWAISFCPFEAAGSMVDRNLPGPSTPAEGVTAFRAYALKERTHRSRRAVTIVGNQLTSAI